MHHAYNYFKTFTDNYPLNTKKSSNNFKMIMYADDTTLYCNIENRDDCEDTINNKL